MKIKPNLVSTGLVKENVHTGSDIDLEEFPAPWYYPKDGGRYIGTSSAVVSKDPATGLINVGTYRVQVQGKNLCTIGFLPGQNRDGDP